MTIFQICTNVVFAPQPKNRGGGFFFVSKKLSQTEKVIDRQVQQISFLSQFIQNVEYISDKENIVLYSAVLILEIAETTTLPDLRQLRILAKLTIPQLLQCIIAIPLI